MDCPHCGIAFHDSWNAAPTLKDHGISWSAVSTVCPSCKNPTIEFTTSLIYAHAEVPTVPKSVRAYPAYSFRKPIPKEVPAELKSDYEEACAVLSVSHKASAALSRRCLQAILRGQGYMQKDLAQQIDAVLNEKDATKAIPTALRQTMDAIRNFGNFSAHPVTDQTTLQIIAVEPNEAEWCLDILEEMSDHYYVRPALAAERKAALDAKLAAAGKPRSK